MAEWLGNGLQNRVQQFDSAWYLKNKSRIPAAFVFEVPSRPVYFLAPTKPPLR